MLHHRHFNTASKRALYSFCLVFLLVAIGTFGMHALERMDYLDAFYFVSMLATAQGADYTPQYPAAKIFASLFAYISVGIVVVALGVLFGPFLGKLWRVGALKHDEELKKLKDKIKP